MPAPPSQSNAAGETAAAHPFRAGMRLETRVVLRFSAAVALGLVILFVPAGSFHFWQGWLYLGLVLGPTLGAFVYFLKVDRDFLERRLEMKEQVREQRLLLLWLQPVFFAIFLLPGFDHRMGWSRALAGTVPLWLSLLAGALVLAGLFIVVWAMNVNRFAAHTVRVETGQKVICTGPYALVRHPLYAGSVVLWLFTPLALGSWVALPFFVLLLPFYVIRLLNEEKVLRVQLPGYTEYCQHTRSRLIPFVW